MANPVVAKILEEGVHAVKVSMLSPELRRRLLTDAGDKLLHMQKLQDAAHTYALAGNIEKLRETAEWLTAQRKFGQAAMFLKPVGRPAELEELAENCVDTGEIAIAKELYEELGQDSMVQFLNENFK